MVHHGVVLKDNRFNSDWATNKNLFQCESVIITKYQSNVLKIPDFYMRAFILKEKQFFSGF